VQLTRLKTANWAPTEIQELKGKLKQFIKIKKVEKENLENRVSWYGSNSFFEIIESLDSQPVFNKDSGVYAQSVNDYFESTIFKLIEWRNKQKNML
jgi:hypothetical protein